MPRTRGGLNNYNKNCDYFSNRGFAAVQEIWNKRNSRFKIKFALVQNKNINVKQCGNIVRRMTVRRHPIFPAARRIREY